MNGWKELVTLKHTVTHTKNGSLDIGVYIVGHIVVKYHAAGQKDVKTGKTQDIFDLKIILSIVKTLWILK